MSNRKLSRRRFLGEASCAAIGTTTLFSSIMNLGMANALARPMWKPTGDYKAMVCILLGGGNDSFNMLAPNGAGYSEYAAIRTNMAIPQNELLSVGMNQGISLGLHPAMTNVANMYSQNRAAFISNVGTLVEPTTKQQIADESVPLPLGLLSHSDQVMHWQTSIPQDRSSIGWGGRMADILQSGNTDQTVSMNISLNGNNILQTGNEVSAFSINNDVGGVGVLGYGEQDAFHQLMTSGVNSLLEQQYQDVFKKTYSNVVKNSISQNEFFNDGIAGAPDFADIFTNGVGISQDLRMVARTIASQSTLGMERQTFSVQIGGFDMHDELINAHNTILTNLDNALNEFYTALDQEGLSDCVTTFTISDFARTLVSNGNGTDHGWGGNVMVLGGAQVNGGQIYGTYPDLALGSDLELGGGIYIPTTSADEYFAELAMWFGVSQFDLPMILPNIGNFYSVGSGDNPIGFMQL